MLQPKPKRQQARASCHPYLFAGRNRLGARGVLGNDTGVDGGLVAPAVLAEAADPVALPGPEDPAAGLLVGLGLGAPELAVEGLEVGVVLVALGGPPLVVAAVRGHLQRPLAHDAPAVAVVGARRRQVVLARRALAELGVPAVVLVVVGRQQRVVRRQVAGRVARPPRLAHVHDVELVLGRHPQALLPVADARPRGRVEVLDHVGRLARELARVHGLVHDLQRVDVAVVLVLVDALGHPLEELVGALEVGLRVEAGVGGALIDRQTLALVTTWPAGGL